MREIKFRAWANGHEKWCHNIEYMGDGFWLGYVDDGVGELSTTDIIVEQYTGLKDKNGKEIYEGDIVKINGWWDAAGPAGYDKNLCTIKWDEEITGFAPFNDYDCDCSVYHYAEDCEVVGNIHENPELLGEEEE